MFVSCQVNFHFIYIQFFSFDISLQINSEMKTKQTETMEEQRRIWQKYDQLQIKYSFFGFIASWILSKV